MRGPVLCALAILAGCQSTPKPPEVVTVTVKEIVPVPPELSAPCHTPAKQGDTYGHAILVANQRLAALLACNERMRQIRDLAQDDEPR